MMTKEDISALERSIKEQSDNIYSISFNYVMGEMHGTRNEEKDEEDEDEENKLYYNLQTLYLKIRCYLEAKNLLNYLNAFVEKIAPFIENKREALQVSGPYMSDGDPYLTAWSEMNTFLVPFPVFEDRYKKKKDISFVEEILKNSGRLITHRGVSVKNEADIYREVKWFLEILFPSIRQIEKARFIRKFKTYHPDILIPEIKVVIEYKLIREGRNIDDYVDQVKTDANNYEGDSEFEIFYAVFFIIGKPVTKKAVLESWKERKFPDNWHPIVVME